ncbi:hypothetical protein [Paenibacillus sp. HW567]|uniref:hypothetical protein n=1 Tax=Paenibacillus sp. HW567 TaxID=1034769 RepID=UPI00037D25B3|nr:hypothetical protein [Paenibacillus sp. HW567]
MAFGVAFPNLPPSGAVGKCRESRRYQGNGLEMIHASISAPYYEDRKAVYLRLSGHLRWYNDNFVLSGRGYFVFQGGDGHGGWLVVAVNAISQAAQLYL